MASSTAGCSSGAPSPCKPVTCSSGRPARRSQTGNTSVIVCAALSNPLRSIPVKAWVILGAFLAAAPAFAQQQGVKVDGSSTVYPITEAVAEEFQKAKKNAVKVTVGISGTSGGFKEFCRGETDVSAASGTNLEKRMAHRKTRSITLICQR